MKKSLNIFANYLFRSTEEKKGKQTDKRADVLMFEYLRTVSFTSSRWFSKLLLLLS